MKAIKNIFLLSLLIISSFLLFSCTKKIELESFSFTRPNIEVFLGNIIYLEFDKTPNEANYYKIKFTSSDKKIAEVNGDGKVTTKNYGQVTITAKDQISGAEAKCEIKVTDGKVYKIDIDEDSINSEYYKGQTFDKENLIVNAYYESGQVIRLNQSEYEVICPEILTENTTIVVNYKTFTTSFDVMVKEDYKQKIEVTKNPNKTFYYIGEYFNPNGMEVYLTYASGKKEIITDFTFENSALNYDTTFVTINYEEFKIDLEITVDAKIKINDLSKLQNAINNAKDGDSILILDGIYNISQTFSIPSSKNITILGASQTTTINAHNCPVFEIINDGNAGNITIARLTLVSVEGEIKNLISNPDNIDITLNEIN